jgi:hypothetical protein
MLRWRRLNRTDRIGCRKAVDQAGLKFGVDIPIGQRGLAGTYGMPVVCRRIEFLGHVKPPSQDNADIFRTFRASGGMSPKLCRRCGGRQPSAGIDDASGSHPKVPPAVRRPLKFSQHGQYCTDRRRNF